MIIFKLIIVFSIICFANCAKILGVFHMSAYSHFTLGNSLLKELASKGHEVTMISAFDQQPPVKNYRTILATEIKDYFAKHENITMGLKNMSLLSTISLFNKMTYEATEMTLNNTNVQKLLQSNEKFDVVIIEQFMNEAFRGFQYHYNIPCIIFSTVGTNSWTNAIVGNPAPPSVAPEMSANIPEKMAFFDRLKNTLISTFMKLVQYYWNLNNQNILLHKYFPGAPHIVDLVYNTSLVLLNSHTSINQPVPLVPNMIEVGGLHVKPPGKLPKDLQNYLDEAKEGVIFFSLGSNVKSKNMDVDKREAIIKVLSKLKMKVLWKWEDENLPGKPKNVKISKWLPQQEILAHPNVKLFITHGGLLSTIETIYHGKPVLGIPFFGDQESNMQIAVSKGYGLHIDYKDLNEETFSSTLNELLTNKKYAENAKKRSKLMHDRPVKPLDLAVFWVEYVIRNNGAYHLRSSALDLNIFQYLLLDVAAFITAVSIIPIAIVVFIFKKIFKKLPKSNQITTKKNSNKQKKNKKD